MNKRKRFTGKTYNETLTYGQDYYNVKTSEEFDVKIIQKGSRGIFGVFSKDWIIEIILKTNDKLTDEPENEKTDYRVEEALKVSEEMDGYFGIDYKKKSAFLTVYPPGKTGKPTTLEEVQNRLRVLKIENIDEKALNDAINKHDGVSVRIGDWPYGETLNGWFKIDVSDDKLEAFMTLYPPKPGGASVIFDDVISGLKTKNIVVGIDESSVKNVIDNELYFKKHLIAKGIPPVKGKDAKIKYNFNTENKLKPEIVENGSVDLKRLGLIQSVKKGFILSKKIPSTKGIDGTNIFGKKILAQDGEDIEFRYNSDNIEISDDKTYLTAKIDGRIYFYNGKIILEKILKIEGDVNYSTGNIDFLGTVVITGKVEDNFIVKADGDIFIKKTIGKSIVESKNSIIVEGGILGKGESFVKAENNVLAKFIESGNVVANQNVIVDKVIMHSNITAGTAIIVKGDKGAVIGGLNRAGKKIEINESGAIGGTITELEVGLSPDVLFKLNQLNEKKILEIKRINKIALGIETLERKRIKNIISSKEEGQLKQLTAMLDKANLKLEEVYHEINQLTLVIQPDHKAQIKIKNKVYPGTKVIIGDQTRFIKDDNKYSYVTFKYGDNDLKVLPFN